MKKARKAVWIVCMVLVVSLGQVDPKIREAWSADSPGNETCETKDRDTKAGNETPNRSIEESRRSALIEEANSHFRRARTLREKGKCEEAVSEFRKALAIDVKYRKEYAVCEFQAMGDCYRELQRYADAKKAYDEALALEKQAPEPDPDSLAVLHNNLGTVHRAAGHYPKALEHFEKALDTLLRTHGENRLPAAISRNNLGLAYHSAGDCARPSNIWKTHFSRPRDPTSNLSRPWSPTVCAKFTRSRATLHWPYSSANKP